MDSEESDTEPFDKSVTNAVPCTNECGKTLQRQNLDNHIANDCPLTIIDCDFQHVGCKMRLPRQDMPAHLADSIVSHVSLQAAQYRQVVVKLDDAQKEISRLQERNGHLEQQVATLTQDIDRYVVRSAVKVCPCKLTILNFTQNGICITSPFYSHSKGCKMCLAVCAKTGWLGNCTISACIVHMTGEFDSELSWPFQARAQVTLLCLDDDNDENSLDKTATIDVDFKWPAYATPVIVSHNCRHRTDYSELISTPQRSLHLYSRNGCLKLAIELTQVNTSTRDIELSGTSIASCRKEVR